MINNNNNINKYRTKNKRTILSQRDTSKTHISTFKTAATEQNLIKN